MTVTIGSVDHSAGRYLAVIEGLSIEPPGDRDQMTLRMGPLARETELFFFMVGAPDTRLDPVLRHNVDDDPVTCDDAGQRGCEAVPTLTDMAVRITAGEGTHIVADRLDAGLRLSPGHSDPLFLELASRARGTHGPYSILLLGELLPRDLDQ